MRWWYHFDDPKQSPAELIAKFEAANPGIKIAAEAIPWGGGSDYDTRLFAAIVANAAPDCAMVKLSNQGRSCSMEALEPLDGMIAGWSAKSDISDNVWKVNRATDGKQYFLPLQYVVLYLYYRTDLFQAAGLKPPTTFDEFLTAAKALTKGDMYGFGMRGGAGGYDNWGPFVLGGGAKFEKGGFVSDAALAANRWYVGLGTEHKVMPAFGADRQLPPDRRRLQGRPHGDDHPPYRLLAQRWCEALGDKVSAVPVPRGPDGKGWTVFRRRVECHLRLHQEQGGLVQVDQLPVDRARTTPHSTSSPASCRSPPPRLPTGQVHPKRFVDASFASLPIAAVLPDTPKTDDFVRTRLADQHAAGAARPDQARRHDEGDRGSLLRLGRNSGRAPSAARPPFRPKGPDVAIAAPAGTPAATLTPYLFLLPALAVTAAVILVPVAQTVWMSLHDFILFKPKTRPSSASAISCAPSPIRCSGSRSATRPVDRAGRRLPVPARARRPRCCSTRASGGAASRGRWWSCPGRCRASSSA